MLFFRHDKGTMLLIEGFNKTLASLSLTVQRELSLKLLSWYITMFDILRRWGLVDCMLYLTLFSVLNQEKNGTRIF